MTTYAAIFHKKMDKNHCRGLVIIASELPYPALQEPVEQLARFRQLARQN